MFKEIAFTVYAVTDIRKSREFYEGKLGLKPNGEFDKKEDSQWIEYNIGPGTLSIGCAPDQWKPSENGATAALECIDFDKAVADLKAKGVNFFMEPQSFPTCKMAVITDPDKNKILIHQRAQK
ncbi:MAG: putative Lactoylglutathione lyase [Candidatus Taylorbacteria bacterium]|nr:putative Lactoylglutathione lyase [Candidatus Taylorbacteria bacterium]